MRAVSESYPQLDLGKQLCFALYSASRAVTRAYAPLLEELGLTYPQYVTMLALWEEPDRALSVGDLGTRLHLDSGTLTPLLKRLEHLGLVDRRRDAADERRVLVTVTDAGLALRERAASVPGRIFPRFGMDLGEIIRLREELTRIVELIESSGR